MPDQAFGLRPAYAIDAQIPADADIQDIEPIRSELSILEMSISGGPRRCWRP